MKSVFIASITGTYQTATHICSEREKRREPDGPRVNMIEKNAHKQKYMRK